MKSILITSALSLITISSIYANNISGRDAEKIATTFFNERSQNEQPFSNNKSASINSVTLSYTENIDNPVFYIFNNNSSEGGFVIVSGEDGVKTPILGYSTSGKFDAENVPDNFKDILFGYAKEIEYIRETGIKSNNVNHLKSASTATIVVAPLLKTTWNQTAPYSNMVSKYFEGLTGCVPTAMAQIMKYWEWPKQGRGCHTNAVKITPKNWEELLANEQFNELSKISEYVRVDFSESVYDWDNMLNSYSSSYTEAQVSAVAKLMLDCNTSVNAQKTLDGVSAYTSDVPLALSRYFGYNSNYQQIDALNDIDIIKKELDASRPVLIRGVGDNEIRHCFICDGYDSNDYFHFNFGWEGSNDGYYLMTLINPGPKNFSSKSVTAFIGIYPIESVEIDNVFYNVVNKEEAQVVGAREVDDCIATIKDKVDIGGKTYNVTSIGQQAFYNNKYLTEITIPNSIKRIESSAFYCESLKRVNINSVESYCNIEYANSNSRPLCGSVYVNQTIDLYLNNEPIVDLAIPGTVTEVKSELFVGCNTIKSVTFFIGLTKIGDKAFSNCKNLETVTFPYGGALEIGESAFRGCTKLTTATPLSLAVKIGKEAFYDTHISYNLGMAESVGENAFPSQDYVQIPTSLVKIGRGAFKCQYEYEVSINNPCFSDINGVLFDKSQTILIDCPPMEKGDGWYGSRIEYSIPSTTKTIKAYALLNNVSIRELTIPQSVEYIETGAFRGAEQLTKVTNYALKPQKIDDSIFPSCIFEREGHEPKLHVTKGYKEVYENADIWNKFEIIDDIPVGSSAPQNIEEISRANGLLIEFQDGTSVECLFSKQPKITYSKTDNPNTELVMSADGLNVKYNTQDISKMKFIEIKEEMAIKDIKYNKKLKIKFSTTNINISGLDKGEIASAYALDGTMLYSAKANADGVVNLNIIAPKSAIIIVRAGNQSFKVQRQ